MAVNGFPTAVTCGMPGNGLSGRGGEMLFKISLCSHHFCFCPWSMFLISIYSYNSDRRVNMPCTTEIAPQNVNTEIFSIIATIALRMTFDLRIHCRCLGIIIKILRLNRSFISFLTILNLMRSFHKISLSFT